MIDLGVVVDDDVLERAYESALWRGYTTDGVTLGRLDGRPGTLALRRVLARRGIDTSPTDSDLETRFLQLVRRAHLPTPHRQLSVNRFRLDFAWPTRRLAVELDGMTNHTGRAARQSDNTRQNQIVLLGWTVLRFTYADLTERPQQVCALLGRALVA